MPRGKEAGVLTPDSGVYVCAGGGNLDKGFHSSYRHIMIYLIYLSICRSFSASSAIVSGCAGSVQYRSQATVGNTMLDHTDFAGRQHLL